MPALSARPLFSRAALLHYFRHIALPSRYSTPPSIPAARDSSADSLSYLRALQKYQQATVPFTNLYLHYSKHHTSTLHPYELYEYIVNGGGMAREGSFGDDIAGEGWHSGQTDLETRQRRHPPSDTKLSLRGGRGGSCTLNNSFFSAVLRSLGYAVVSGGARVAKAANGGPKDVFGGLDHMVNLVTIEGRRYLVDVGFGGNGPTEPVLLEDGREVAWGVTDDMVRVIYTRLKQFTDPGSWVWVLQHKKADNTAWDDIYAFTEMEFLAEDFEVMNYRSTRDSKSWFTQKVVCVKTVLDDDEDDVAGVILLTDGKVKRRIRGKNHHLEDCKTELARVDVLKKYFGVLLTEEERVGISGMVTELKG